MVVLTQKGENENLTKNIFRVMGANESLSTLTKPQGDDRVTARLLPPNFMARSPSLCTICYVLCMFVVQNKVYMNANCGQICQQPTLMIKIIPIIMDLSKN